MLVSRRIGRFCDDREREFIPWKIDVVRIAAVEIPRLGIRSSSCSQSHRRYPLRELIDLLEILIRDDDSSVFKRLSVLCKRAATASSVPTAMVTASGSDEMVSSLIEISVGTRISGSPELATILPICELRGGEHLDIIGHDHDRTLDPICSVELTYEAVRQNIASDHDRHQMRCDL